MALGEYVGVVQDTAGNAQINVPVTVMLAGGGAATIYATVAGGTPLASLASDVTGTFRFAADTTAQYVVTPLGYSPRTLYIGGGATGATGATGAVGAPGVGGTPRGVYAAGTTYALGDQVFSAGQWYSSLAGVNTGNTPASSPTWWQPTGLVPSGPAGTAGQMILVRSDGTIKYIDPPRVYAAAWGAAPATADNTTAINNAITQAQALGGATVELPSGVLQWAGTITVPGGGCGLWGNGGQLGTTSATELKATNAAAIVKFNTSGGTSGNLRINGNGVATAPCKIGEVSGAQSAFIGLTVDAAVQDNILIVQCQNHRFVNCSSQLAGRDNLVLDQETGGHVFVGFESYGAVRNALRIQQTRTSPVGAYVCPSHIRFDHSIFEGGGAAAPRVALDAGQNLQFYTCVVERDGSTQVAVALTDAHGTGTVAHFSSSTITGAAAAPAAFSLVPNVQLRLTGDNAINGFTKVFDVASGGTVTLHNAPIFTGPTTLTGSSQYVEDAYLSTPVRSALTITRQAVDAIALVGSVIGEAGQRWRTFADGSTGYGDGAGFSFPLQTGRHTTTQWGLIGGSIAARTLGQGFRVAEGANAKQGLTAAMVAGTVTLANTSITANSRIIATRQAGGTNPGAVYESARTAGTSCTFTSTNAADTGQVAYQIFEPAA